MTSAPLVSVIIPTHRRPQLVPRAVSSALAQTLEDIEVIVVVDGPEQATQAALAEIDDPRLQVHVLAENRGAPDARNAGIRLARSEWISPLDDDDEFLPLKLELQLQAAQISALRYPIIACRVAVVTETSRMLWPRREPEPGEPISEYLFCRRSFFFGEGVLPTHAIFAPKELFERIPYTSGLPKHQDLDWILRACAEDGAGVRFVPSSQPLAVWHMERARGRSRRRSGWQQSLDFVRLRRHLVTRRAYAGFLLTWLGPGTMGQRDWGAFAPRLVEAVRWGQPSAVELASYFAYWFAPHRLRDAMAAAFSRRQRGQERAG
jgi:glycosyltransferase involved in cell wall biosynthesis